VSPWRDGGRPLAGCGWAGDTHTALAWQCLGQSPLLSAESRSPSSAVAGISPPRGIPWSFPVLGTPLCPPVPGLLSLCSRGGLGAAVPAHLGAEGRVVSGLTGDAPLARTPARWRRHREVTREGTAVSPRWASPPGGSSSRPPPAAGSFPWSCRLRPPRLCRELKPPAARSHGEGAECQPHAQGSEAISPWWAMAAAPPCTHPHPRLPLPGHLQNGLLRDEHARR